jgi:DNA invertase Pin-like site-specific DNA recombinase
MSKVAYSYIRFSTKGQIKGDSLQRQLEGARKYARDNGLDLQEVSFKDLGLSAFKGKNATEGQLKAFLDAVDDGSIASDVILLVESFDRLSRAKVREALDLFLGIVKRGVTIITLTDGQVYNQASIDENFTKLFTGLVFMSRAHEESSTKSVRVRSGIARALADGKKHQKCPMWLRVGDDHKSFVVVEEKAEVIRQVFQMRAEGIGALRIAQFLNENHGFKWGSPQVARLLQNPAVIGTRISQAGHEPIVNYYEPIVSKSLFYDVQRLMSSASKGTRRGRRPKDEPNLFAGLARCGSCGSALRFFRETKSVKQRYLKCHNAVNKSGCDASYVNYDALESEVIAWLLMDQDEEIVPILEKQPRHQKAVLSAEIISLKEQHTRLMELYAAGSLINTASVIQKMNAIDLQIRHHEAAIIQEEANTDERLPAEKAWSLAVRHQDAALGDNKEYFFAVRRELKVAFQKAILAMHVYPERRVDDTVHCKVSVQFRGYDGEPSHEYVRPALNNVRGVRNGTKVQPPHAETPAISPLRSR